MTRCLSLHCLVKIVLSTSQTPFHIALRERHTHDLCKCCILKKKSQSLGCCKIIWHRFEVFWLQWGYPLCTALSLELGSNHVNISPAGHWPLADQRITKSCLTSFYFLPSGTCSSEGTCFTLCLATTGGKKSETCCWIKQKPFQRMQQVKVCPHPGLCLSFSFALRSLHFYSLLCQRQTLLSCVWSVCNKRADF